MRASFTITARTSIATDCLATVMRFLVVVRVKLTMTGQTDCDKRTEETSRDREFVRLVLLRGLLTVRSDSLVFTQLRTNTNVRVSDLC